MFLPSDLRLRVSLVFGVFGALVSLVMALVLYEGAHDLGQRLIDETLNAELDDYIARRDRNPASLPPSTVLVQGFVRNADGSGALPDYLDRLPPGRHDIRLGDIVYRAMVLERAASRYYLLYDTSVQLRRERRFAWMLGLLVIAMTMVSALGGIWISRMVVAPVAKLAAKMRNRSPDDWDRPLSEDFPRGEIGELARVFDRQLIRMRAFMERERAFSSDISHELRTTLAVILSTTEILLEDASLTPGQLRRIRRIEQAARDMAELGTALLLIAREERSTVASGGCVVSAVVEETVADQQHLLVGKAVDVRVEASPELVLPVDVGLVRILVANLVRNAFAYTAAGSVHIVVDRDSLTVADTGKGIPNHAIQQVFVRQFRDVDSEGAGIGLSLVKRICDRYGWRITLESRPDEGTRVRVAF